MTVCSLLKLRLGFKVKPYLHYVSRLMVFRLVNSKDRETKKTGDVSKVSSRLSKARARIAAMSSLDDTLVCWHRSN